MPGHNEAATGKVRVTQLILDPAQESITHGVAGRLVLSGSKLLLDTGTAWETVTSA